MRRYRQWLVWFGALLVVGVLMYGIRAELDKAHIALAFLLIVLGASSMGGRAIGVAIALAAFVSFDWFFLPPYGALSVANPLDWLVLFAFLVTCVVAAQLFEMRRVETLVAERRASEIDRLAVLGAETLKSPRAEDALAAIAGVIRQEMQTDSCEIFLRGEGGELYLADDTGSRSPAAASSLLRYSIEHSQSAIERSDGTMAFIGDVIGTTASEGSASLADLHALAISLRVRAQLVGALRLSSARPFTLTRDQRRVLGALAYYAALGVERVRLAQAEETTESLRRADRLKDALLAAVSHDLRTPLTAIKGIANEIWHGGDASRAAVIEEEADRMNALVRDLLELSQLNAGSLRLSVGINTIDDVAGAALAQVEPIHGEGRVDVSVVNDGSILLGEFDLTHTVRAVVNLLENALKYTRHDDRVSLRAERHDSVVRIVVEDTGAGVLPGDEERIFEPFVRGTSVPDGVRGTGLGLSIARQIAELQGGQLRYERREGGGSRFILEVNTVERDIP